MTFEQLLGLDSRSLEQLTEQELREILQPCLEICPPIDIQVLQKEKLELDLKKIQEKEQKKEEKKLAKLNVNMIGVENAGAVISVVKKKSSLKAKNILENLKAMQAMITEKMKETTK